MAWKSSRSRGEDETKLSGVYTPFTHIPEKSRIFLVCSRSGRAKPLRELSKSLISSLPNFARACGRVSIGGHPDKRPDSRPERDRDDRKVTGSSELRTLDWQPEAKPAHLVLHGGRGLKQRRSGLFWSLPVLHKPARATEEACSSLPAVRSGVSPFQSKAAWSGFRVPGTGASPSRVGATSKTRITSGG